MVHKADGSDTTKKQNDSEGEKKSAEERSDNVCITIDEIIEGISFADQSSGLQSLNQQTFRSLDYSTRILFRADVATWL